MVGNGRADMEVVVRNSNQMMIMNIQKIYLTHTKDVGVMLVNDVPLKNHETPVKHSTHYF